MKKKFLPIPIALAMIFSMNACKNATPTLENRQDTLSWAMGRSIAEDLIKESSVEFNKDMVMTAIQSTLNNEAQPIADSTYTQAIQYIQMMIMTDYYSQNKQSSQESKNQESDYFAQLEKEKPNIKKTESGIFYEIIQKGSGKKAKYGEVVKFDYRGYNMITGELFDQTYGQHEPIQHVIGNPMFKGLIEGLQLMNAGSKFRFYIPNHLAFGEKGATHIPPFTPVIYEIELHAIK